MNSVGLHLTRPRGRWLRLNAAELTQVSDVTGFSADRAHGGSRKEGSLARELWVCSCLGLEHSPTALRLPWFVSGALALYSFGEEKSRVEGNISGQPT